MFVSVVCFLFISSQDITSWWLSMQMVIKVVMTTQSSTQHNCRCYTDIQHTCYKWCWNFESFTIYIHTFHMKRLMKTLDAAWICFGISSWNYYHLTQMHTLTKKTSNNRNAIKFVCTMESIDISLLLLIFFFIFFFFAFSRLLIC